MAARRGSKKGPRGGYGKQAAMVKSKAEVQARRASERGVSADREVLRAAEKMVDVAQHLWDVAPPGYVRNKARVIETEARILLNQYSKNPDII